MIFDMMDAMKNGHKGRTGTKRSHCLNQPWVDTLSGCKSQREFIHPRDKSPPCLFRDTQNMMFQCTIDSVATQDSLNTQDFGFEQIDCLGSINETLYIDAAVTDEQEYITPQTTHNPLFWTYPEYSGSKHSSDDECETEPIPDDFDSEPSCLLESLQFRAQQVLEYIDTLPCN